MNINATKFIKAEEFLFHKKYTIVLIIDILPVVELHRLNINTWMKNIILNHYVIYRTFPHIPLKKK